MHGLQFYLKQFSLVMFSLLVLISLVMAQEHPVEHPKKEKPQEHPTEHPQKAGIEVTKESLSQAIEDYVKKDAALHGGYFLFYDAQEKEPLALELIKVHKDRLSKISDDVYFACCDFKATNGHVYDLDIFMKGPSADKLVPTEVTLHKKDGKARYTWYEEGGVWKRKEK